MVLRYSGVFAAEDVESYERDWLMRNGLCPANLRRDSSSKAWRLFHVASFVYLSTKGVVLERVLMHGVMARVYRDANLAFCILERCRALPSGTPFSTSSTDACSFRHMYVSRARKQSPGSFSTSSCDPHCFSTPVLFRQKHVKESRTNALGNEGERRGSIRHDNNGQPNSEQKFNVSH